MKILTAPNVGVNASVQRMRELYEAVGVNVQLASTENLSLPNLNDVDVGKCVMGTTTDEQDDLFADGTARTPTTSLPTSSVRPSLRSTDAQPIPTTVPPWSWRREPLSGPWPTRPGAFFSLRHVNDNDRLMTGNGTGNITNPPPNIVADEIAEMLASDYSRNL